MYATTFAIDTSLLQTHLPLPIQIIVHFNFILSHFLSLTKFMEKCINIYNINFIFIKLSMKYLLTVHLFKFKVVDVNIFF